jgi:hypothetical protein
MYVQKKQQMHFKLKDEIILLSNSQNWEIAKLEWNFELAYYSEDLQTCLCGHYPIKNICVIRNTKNSNETEVGNCCIKKFLGIDDGDKIFNSIKKVKDEISKSISIDVLEYLYNKKAISDFEFKFYLSIHRKRILTNKQTLFKEKVNWRFLDFTSYETNSQFIRINLVLKWAEKNSFFNTDFVTSLKRSCEKNGKLTDNQKNSLENIIKKMKID